MVNEMPNRDQPTSSSPLLLGAGGYLRLKQILQPIGPLPISKSAWWEGVRTARYPQPVKLGPRITAWRCEDIGKLMNQIDGRQPLDFGRSRVGHILKINRAAHA